MGRPTKLTPEVQAKIVEAILHGASYQDASESVGVWYTTFNAWMKRGEESKMGIYYDFNEAVKMANAQCAMNFTRVVQSAAAQGDWKAALEWLKRRRRSEWGDNIQQDITSGGEPLKPPQVIEIIKTIEKDE